MTTLKITIWHPAKDGQGCAPNFAIEMWSIYQQPEFGLPCTNNVVEDWHRSFQHKYLSKQFWCLIDGTKDSVFELSFKTQSL